MMRCKCGYEMRIRSFSGARPPEFWCSCGRSQAINKAAAEAEAVVRDEQWRKRHLQQTRAGRAGVMALLAGKKGWAFAKEPVEEGEIA